ncbi:host specificity factor TipJ family phage tail protein [Bosea sp. LjRoot90]|uniref:host specificity factor TipJ family phage tail protein n=1 Tax=Bosea sp. LjRoot90 TaxID=3342342 RepID=UPI003ED10794
MTTILFQRCDGKPAGSPVELKRARRRLSALMRQNVDRTRPHIVSVHRRGEPWAVTDQSVRLRRHWRHTRVNPTDTVIVTYLPRGGGGGAASGRGGGKAMAGSIGLVVAAIALMAIGQFWAVGAIAGALGTTSAVASTIWGVGSAALLAGAGYLLSQATQAKANKEQDDRPVYGVSGGGNRPRSGDRIPIVYGRCWHVPDLSQPDYTVNDGEDQILYKRLTIGCGKYALKAIRVGGVMMWTDDGGLTPPFVGANFQMIAPGGTSSLVPGQVASVTAVGGNQVPRATDFPQYAGPFDFGSGAPLQTTLQLDYSLPQGVYAVPDGGKFEGKQFPTDWGVRFDYAPCNEEGVPTGAFSTFYEDSGNALTTRPMRYTRFVTLPSGRYTIRAQNIGAPESVDHPAGFAAKVTNTVFWDGLRAHIPQTAVRQGVTELAMVVHSGKALGITAFADVEVEISRILPVWYGEGAGWIEEETDKCVWAAADILRDPLHGCGEPASRIDLDRLQFYGETLAQFDRFSGVIRGPVSAYEALTTVLGTMRASPLRLGNVHTIVRDEPKSVRRHVITRRQIRRDTSAIDFNLDLSDGSADVIVEWLTDGDPKRRRERRVTAGTQTNVPRRMFAAGVTDEAHAVHIATWAAYTAYYRRERRSFSTTLPGRLVLPNDLAMIDAWFFDQLQAPAIMTRDGLAVTVDEPVTIEVGTYAALRARDGRHWGPVRVTQDGDRLLLDADDVEQAEDLSGLSLDEVLASDTQQATTLLIGTLQETGQDSWLIRSVGFSGENVDIEAVFDAPQVWSALAEAIIVTPPPPSSGLENEASVAVPYVSAKAVQRNGAMFMDWTVGRSRTPASYVVQISYDDWTTYEEVSRGDATSGSYPLREVDSIILVRAFGISTSGVRSPYVFNQFAAVPAAIDLGNSTPGTLPYEALLDGMEVVGVVGELPDLFGYDGPKIIALVEPGEKPQMFELREGGSAWEPLAAADYIANTITAAAVQAGAIKAVAIDVENLAAISANLGAITAGSININNRFIVASNGTVTISSASTGTRLVITNSQLLVYDASNVLRVQLGIW